MMEATKHNPKAINTIGHIVTKGSIHHDHYSKGRKNGRRVFNDRWCAEITIDGQRYKHRAVERMDCEEWLKAVRSNRIRPTDNKADWWRIEQKKDEAARVDEIIVSQAEEAVLIYEYHQSGDLTKIYEYVVKRLLPHMAYYCAHTLQFGRDTTLVASKQAIALLLTRIVNGRPILSMTASCKKMLRVYKEQGNFFYYERAPEKVKLMVNGINLEDLARIWKVTKDKRL